MSEDANVDHLLDVFAPIDTDSGDVWDARNNFITLLNWRREVPYVGGIILRAL
jgi:hypothetical protein